NFTVHEGDIVGIIGPNGAGKSTLCRVLSGILKADKGEVFVEGEVTALLSFGTGFNMQLTGRDNVYLNGMMLGIPKKKLLGLYEDIMEFSGLGKFMDQPVKNYSNGMKSRLGFSVAAMIKPDLFIIDEALSVGDASFFEKASAKIQELIGKAKAVIVVTHNMSFVEKVCTRALWLGDGIIKFDGDPKEAVIQYRQSLKR
ncbi:MAG TPA: teichoic acid ABC transporter ATP-binding protein, partial [Pelotomaculum sp.]|nr:teichoic acid ABC transporter ATP-binding protein [Pelotomaculum sp.]